MALTVTSRQTLDTPVGNPAYWITVSGPASEYRHAGRKAGAHARKIAKGMSPIVHAHRITSGCSFTGGGTRFEERVLYAFHRGEIN